MGRSGAWRIKEPPKTAVYQLGNRAAAGVPSRTANGLRRNGRAVRRYIDALEVLAYTAKDDATKLAATVACLNRLDGYPKAMTEIAALEASAGPGRDIRVRSVNSVAAKPKP